MYGPHSRKSITKSILGVQFLLSSEANYAFSKCQLPDPFGSTWLAGSVGVLHKKHMAVTNEGLLLGRLGRGYEQLSPTRSNTTHFPPVMLP